MNMVRLMDYTPKTKIFENDSIEIYTEVEYNSEFIQNLANYIIRKKNKILHFFNIDEFRKVRINLFDSIENYRSFSLQYIQISSYSEGNCCNGTINYICDRNKIKEPMKAGFLFACLTHELVHLIIYEKVTKNTVIWLEEGLAQYLSGQKSFLEANEQKYSEWLINNVLNKEIPDISFLNKHGSSYGEFCDLKTNMYNGYDISYAIIRYIIDKYSILQINEIIRNNYLLQELENHLINDFKTYYLIND